MPQSFEKISKPPKEGKNPYELQVSETFMPDGGQQVNVNAPGGGSMQLNKDATGNLTMTKKQTIDPSNVMPFVSLQPAAGALDQIFGTQMAQYMPTQSQLVGNLQRIQGQDMESMKSELLRKQLADYGKIDPLTQAKIDKLRADKPGMTPYQRESLKLAKDKAARDTELKKAQAEEKDARKKDILNKKVEKYSDKLHKSKIPQLTTMMGEVSGLMSKYDDLPGQGKGKNLPDFYYEGKRMLGDEEAGDAIKLRASLQSLFNTKLAERSGAAVTAQELKRLQGEYNAGRLNSDASVRDAMERLRKAMAKDVKNIRTGMGPDVARIYEEERGGDPFLSDLNNLSFRWKGKSRPISSKERDAAIRRIRELESRSQ